MRIGGSSRRFTPQTVGASRAGVIAVGVDPDVPASTRGLTRKFDPRADDGIAAAADAFAMITNDLEVTVAARGAAAPEQDLAIRVRGLRKSYDGVARALDGVDLDVRRGEVLAVLGPNGAGKTTLVEILEGHRAADAGEVSVLGHDPAARERAFRARIGIVLQEDGIDGSLTVREAVDLYSAAYPHPRAAAEVLDLVGLGDRPDVRVSALSGGQRRRLDLALGIAGDPELVFLDEPTTGFDPSARRHSWELISALRDLGKTILLTTHYMDEAQHLADRVMVITRGTVIAEGTPDTLGRGAGEAALVAFRIPYGVAADELPWPFDAEVERRERHVSFRTHTPTRDLAPLLSWGAENEIELEALTVTRPTLEDVYLQLTEEPA
jgi:ABC-2 type transport system ATP-binding protein